MQASINFNQAFLFQIPQLCSFSALNWASPPRICTVFSRCCFQKFNGHLGDLCRGPSGMISHVVGVRIFSWSTRNSRHQNCERGFNDFKHIEHTSHQIIMVFNRNYTPQLDQLFLTSQLYQFRLQSFFCGARGFTLARNRASQWVSLGNDPHVRMKFPRFLSFFKRRITTVFLDILYIYT